MPVKLARLSVHWVAYWPGLPGIVIGLTGVTVKPVSGCTAPLRVSLKAPGVTPVTGCTNVTVTLPAAEAMTLATRIAVMRGGQIEQYATPDELYERPQTLFVAGFVGSPAMNFLPVVLRRNGGAVAAELGPVTIPLDAYAFATPPADGTQAIFGIRPEHAALSGAGVQVATETLFMEPMGADTLGWFNMGSHRLSVRLAPQRARGVAGNVDLALDLRLASLFDATTERRL